MTLEFTYKELSKKLGCTEVTIRHWITHYHCEIIPGKRGRNGSDAIIRITDTTIKAIVRDSIEYAKNGRKPFINFEGCDWNTIEKVNKELPNSKLYDHDNLYNEYMIINDLKSREFNETIYFVNDENVIYKIIENESGKYDFIPVYDTKSPTLTGKFNKNELIDEFNNKWIPVLIRNSKLEWITMPKKMAKLLKKQNKVMSKD